eukprot:2282336-Pyramimonas_sp.AAC.1
MLRASLCCDSCGTAAAHLGVWGGWPRSALQVGSAAWLRLRFGIARAVAAVTSTHGRDWVAAAAAQRGRARAATSARAQPNVRQPMCTPL